MFDDYKVMGKLYVMVFDGGANLGSPKQEIMRLRDNEYCCTALQEKSIHIKSYLAHLIDNNCNGAVLAAKAAKYKVMLLLMLMLVFLLVCLCAILLNFVCVM